MPTEANRLLVITYNFPPDGFVGGLRWAGITKYLTRLGWKVTVVTAAAPGGSDAAPGAQVERCARLWTLADGLRLLRWRNGHASGSDPSPEGSPLASKSWRALDRMSRELAACLTFPDDSRGWMLRAAWHARSVMRRFRPHVVVSSGPPHSAHLAAGLATLGTPVPWYIDLRDPWAGPLAKPWASDEQGRTSVFRALLPCLERLAFRAARGVITNTAPLARALAARYRGVSIACVPNGVDAEGLPPPAPDPYPGLSVAHVGTLYGGRDLGPVVEAFRIFLGRHPEAARAGSALRVAGRSEAPHARALADTVAGAGLAERVEVLGWLPRSQALTVVSRSRLVVVLAQDQELQIPAKLYETVAMGVPTLVIAQTDSATAIEGKRLGAEVRDPADVAGIVGVLERVWQHGVPGGVPCKVAITYDAIAARVAEILGDGQADDRSGR